MAHGLAYLGNPYPMEFLFNVTVFFYQTPVFYKVSKLNQSDYYAEPTDKTMRSFIFKKQAGTWISEGGFTEWQAIQIGEKIELSKL
jgi:hypothetical protein